MNKHILMVIDHQMNPDKYTQEQLDKNTYAAAAYAAAAAAARTKVLKICADLVRKRIPVSVIQKALT